MSQHSVRPLVVSHKVLPSGLLKALEGLLSAAGLQGCYVTSVARTPLEQAQAMLANCRRTGALEQYGIYAAAGDQVIKVFEDNQSLPDEGVLRLMRDKILEIGPERVSHHCKMENAPWWVCDIRKNSIVDHAKFTAACSERGVKLLDENNVFHVEILKEAPVVQTT